jgi:hypothetical protein
MTRHTKVNGKYSINGSIFEILTGSRAQVHHGTAYKTSGGLTKKDLCKNGQGRIVSCKKQKTAKSENRLLEYGWGFEKGKFGAVKLDGAKTSSKKKATRRRKSSSS